MVGRTTSIGCYIQIDFISFMQKCYKYHDSMPEEEEEREEGSHHPAQPQLGTRDTRLCTPKSTDRER